jgi:hypothetical protein
MLSAPENQMTASCSAHFLALLSFLPSNGLESSQLFTRSPPSLRCIFWNTAAQVGAIETSNQKTKQEHNRLFNMDNSCAPASFYNIGQSADMPFRSDISSAISDFTNVDMPSPTRSVSYLAELGTGNRAPTRTISKSHSSTQRLLKQAPLWLHTLLLRTMLPRLISSPTPSR